MRRFLGRLRGLHVGQFAIVLVVIVAATVSLTRYRESVAARAHQRVVDYLAPIQVQTQAQLAILNAGGSLADVRAATAAITKAPKPLRGWARTDEEVLLIALLDVGLAILLLLALALSWVWFGGRNARSRARS